MYYREPCKNFSSKFHPITSSITSSSAWEYFSFVLFFEVVFNAIVASEMYCFKQVVFLENNMDCCKLLNSHTCLDNVEAN